LSAAAEVLSPELVLVSSPEVAARARLLLPDPVRPAAVAPAAPVRSGGVAIFYAVCLAGTVGPFALALVAR